MSDWNHAICERCWVTDHGANDDGSVRWPVRLRTPPGEPSVARICCRCDNPTWVGIFVRAEPGSMPHCAHDVELTMSTEGDDG